MNKLNKILLRSLLFTAALLLMSTSAYAVCTNTDSGDWHNASIWDCGVVPQVVPAAGEDVLISDNTTVFFTADIAEINDLTIGTGATLEQRNTSEQTILGDMQILGT